MSDLEINRIDARSIKPEKFPGVMNKIINEMEKIIVHFFSNPNKINVPFRGFLLEGPSGNGKTEIAKQVARLVAIKLSEVGLRDVSFLFVNSANIAAAKWGEAERKLKTIFNPSKNPSAKLIILFDDIDCLMIKRGANVAVEWHYSINSILFHELDKINPSKIIVIATTNRTDLIDDALRSRLYFYEIESLSLDDLQFITKEIIKKLNIEGNDKNKLMQRVNESIIRLDKDVQLGKIPNKISPNIRDIQHFITKIYIEEMV